jgi:hypothetical protein
MLDTGTVCTNIFLRRLHNFALDMSWLPAPIIVRRQWPKIHFKEKRSVTAEEHQKILSGEQNREWRVRLFHPDDIWEEEPLARQIAKDLFGVLALVSWEVIRQRTSTAPSRSKPVRPQLPREVHTAISSNLVAASGDGPELVRAIGDGSTNDHLVPVLIVPWFLQQQGLVDWSQQPMVEHFLVLSASALLARPKQANAIPVKPRPNRFCACRRVTDWGRPLSVFENIVSMAQGGRQRNPRCGNGVLYLNSLPPQIERKV